MSGSAANGIALAALTAPGDTILVVGKRHYGHYTCSQEGYPKYLGLRVENIPFMEKGLEIDLDALKVKAEKLRPRLLVVGTSIVSFPVALEGVRKIADEVGAKILYDGAHVLGLIAGERFQDPLAEGADILTGSTQKTFPGPIGGVIACNCEAISEKVSLATSSMFSNYCNNRVAALAMSAAEMIRFGVVYAAQVVKNAVAMAEALRLEGLPVLFPER
jgi:glycine hydroxymethyltransferase